MTDLTPPRGTEDLLPPASERMLALYDRAHRTAHLFGFRLVETPAFEDTDLFARTSGETSDVVSKEMYTFRDRSDRSLTLRPEGTAPVVRAYLGHATELGSPLKAYYVNQSWRYSRPQKGRLREFRVFGAEVIGVEGPAADVEIVSLGARFLGDLGLRALEVQINSIGDENCRPAYREALLAYLEAQVPRLRDEHRESFRKNPLRVLDCKDEACREVTLDAPRITDYLDDACREHFDGVLSGLEEEGIPVVTVPTLVRGLDYYTRTTFEFVHGGLSRSQSSVCAGGRYDGLAEVLGGPHTPAVGFGLGLDRAALALEAEGIELDPPARLEVFVVAFGPDALPKARELVPLLRAAGVGAERALEDRPLKAQLKMADRSGARFAAILGEREAKAGEATLRRMADGTQQSVPLTDLPAWIARQAPAAGPPA